MKKRVLIVTGWYPNPQNPIEGIFVQDQAQLLAQQYDVAVLALQLLSLRPASMKGRVQTGCEIGKDSLIVCREAATNMIPRLPWLSAWSLDQAIAGMARRGLRRLQKVWGTPDLIHAHVVLPGGWTAIRIKRWLNVPAMLTEHSSPFSLNLKTAGQRQLVRKTLAYADRVVAVSPSLAAEIRMFEPAVQPMVIGNVIKTAFFTPVAAGRTDPARVGRTCFLCVASLSPRKGVAFLLHAAKLLRLRGDLDFELVIGGDGPQRVELEKLSAELGLTNCCQFLGQLLPEQVRAWMQTCDVFVLPSLHETFGIVVGEAMACGKPVIATKCGGPEFVVGPDTGMLVEPADSVALAEAMAFFVHSRMHYDPLTIRQQIVDRFGSEAFLNRIATLYAELLSSAESRV